MTGIAGFTLGGGIGWLHRKLGLGCYNLRSAEVVTADGALVTANHSEHRDLFWALRGSRRNFGVVTSMEFQIHPIGPMVVAGLIYFPLDHFSALVERHRELRDRFLTNSQHGSFSGWRLRFQLSPKTGWGDRW
jgi:FAD/FMN-containing dehydrogenase